MIDWLGAIGNLKQRGIIRILPGGIVELCEGEHDLEWLYQLEEIINLIGRTDEEKNV